MDLLFTFAYWHSLVKLRLHTDSTLGILDHWTTVLGEECRHFSIETCQSIQTKELQREYESQKRTEARKRAKQGANSNQVAPSAVSPIPNEALAGSAQPTATLNVPGECSTT